MGLTPIQWTATEYLGKVFAGYSFNSHWGCVEQGKPNWSECDFCYAKTMAHRWRLDIWGHDKPRKFQSEKYWQQPYKWNREAEKAWVRLKVFANSMSDWAEGRKDLDPVRERLFKTVSETQWLNWLLLTKLPNRIIQKEYLPNVWYGTSVGVNESRWRIDRLRKVTTAPVRFLSIEPLLEPLPDLDLENIDWVVCGAESGAKARPAKLEWFEEIKAQCDKAQIPFFMKQLGTYLSKQMRLKDGHGGDISEFPTNLQVRQFPKALTPSLT